MLLIGCDPKSDTASLLFGGRSCPTILGTSSEKKRAGEAVTIGDVCFKRDGVFAMELGGPEVGRGCGGRGIIHGFELLDSWVSMSGISIMSCWTSWATWSAADSVCRSPGICARRSSSSVPTICNPCTWPTMSARPWNISGLGGNVGVAGMVINKDDGTGEAKAFAEAVGIPILATIPAHEEIRRKSANYEIVGRPGDAWGPLFEELAANVGLAPPVQPKPLAHEALLNLFKGDDVGRHITLEPATPADMCNASAIVKPSLEVVYDDV